MHDQREWFENRFRSELTWRDGTANGGADWYSQLLTDLTLATGDKAIHYFSARFMPSSGLQAGWVAVIAFTDEIVVCADCDGDPGTSAIPLEVIVTARRTLSSFSLHSDGLARDAVAIASVRITVNYPQFSRTLPLGASDWSDRESETADLITSLRRDVLA